MIKFSDKTLDGGVHIKRYQVDNASDLIDEVINSNLSISTATIREDADLGMHTFFDRTMSYNEFLNFYPMVSTSVGSVSFNLNDNMGSSIYFDMVNDIAVLQSNDPDLELSDIVEKKKKRG